MSPFMKSSYHFIIVSTIWFCSLSINPGANNVDPQLIDVPLPVFKNSLEKTMEAVQNVASAMSHMHVGEDAKNSTNMIISYCEGLLGETAEVLNWSLSTIHDLKGDVVSHMRTWLNTSHTREITCMEVFKNGIDSKVSESLKHVTRLIDEVIGMIQVQQHDYQNVDQPLLLSGGTNFEDAKFSKTPNVTVSQDGSGNFNRIMDAIAAAPSHSQQRFVIFIKKGIYKEYVKIDPTKTNLVLIGEGMDVTTISGNRCNASGWQTVDSATFAVRAEGFIAMYVGFENTAGPNKYQAVSLSSYGDQSVFYRCKMCGYQDTLLVPAGRQFYRECTISGTIDFIFGYGTAVFQNCKILARKNLEGAQNTLTAHGRFAADSSGFSFQFCDVERDSDLGGNVASSPTYLGRPWGKYSRTIFMQSYMSNVIVPEGWLDWNGFGGLGTLYYAEYMNKGGASTVGRVKWPGYHVIAKASEAKLFTVTKFIDGDSWLPSTGVPYAPGLDQV
ncbi:hypothetical protein TB1_001099 [Malus domestica]